MASEDVQRIRRLYDAWLADDYETVFATFHPEIRINPDPQAFWVGVDDVYVGHDGMRRYMGAVYEAFDDYQPEVEDIVEGGDGRVLTLAIERGRGRESGAEVTQHETAHLWTLRDGLATQVDLFLDREPAYAAAGLTKPA